MQRSLGDVRIKEALVLRLVSFTPLQSLLCGPSVLGRSAPQPSVQGRASDVVGFP